MSNRTKEIIIKILIVIGVVLLFAIFPGSIFIGLIFEEETAFWVFKIIFILFMADGYLYLLLLPILGGIEPKAVKAEKYQLVQKSYEELICYLDTALSNLEYTKHDTVQLSPEESMILYIKPIKYNLPECFVVIRIPELTEEIIELSETTITKQLEISNFKQSNLYDANMTVLFCVDHITPPFNRMVNSNYYGVGAFPVGISFGGKNIYISKQKDGFIISKYKRLRRQFIKIMNLKNNN